MWLRRGTAGQSGLYLNLFLNSCGSGARWHKLHIGFLVLA
jgi:hypothetical protein